MKKKENYIKILEIAYNMFAKLGYERTSMALIAQEMGFSKPALYNYFKNKEAIFEKLYESIVDEIIKSYAVDQSINDLESYKLYMGEVGFKTIDGLKSKPEFSNMLMQFFLLGLRNDNIKKLTEKLEINTRIYYETLVEMGLKCKSIQKKDSKICVEMLLMIDQGILDKSMTLDSDTLKNIWVKFLETILHK